MVRYLYDMGLGTVPGYRTVPYRTAHQLNLISLLYHKFFILRPSVPPERQLVGDLSFQAEASVQWSMATRKGGDGMVQRRWVSAQYADDFFAARLAKG